MSKYFSSGWNTYHTDTDAQRKNVTVGAGDESMEWTSGPDVPPLGLLE
jgi:hypothetical protein